MKITMDMNYIKFAVAVAANCSKYAAPNVASTPDEAAEYIREILDVLYSGTSVTAQVMPLVYPRCSKIPLIISLDGAAQSLLWFYPQMTIPELANELEGLLLMMPEHVLSVSA